MVHSLQTVIAAGVDGTPVDVDADSYLRVIPSGKVDATILVATATETTSGTDKQLIAAPGAGVALQITGILITLDTAVSILVHWANGTTDPMMDFGYIAGGGVAYQFGFHGPRGAANEALKVDISAVANVKFTVYYYED